MKHPHKLRSYIYRMAAEMLDERNGSQPNVFMLTRCGCCRVIRMCIPELDGPMPELDAFVMRFRDRPGADCSAYFWAEPWTPAGKRDKQARVLALLFMEQIAKDEK